MGAVLLRGAESSSKSMKDVWIDTHSRCSRHQSDRSKQGGVEHQFSHLALVVVGLRVDPIVVPYSSCCLVVIELCVRKIAEDPGGTVVMAKARASECVFACFLVVSVCDSLKCLDSHT